MGLVVDILLAVPSITFSVWLGYQALEKWEWQSRNALLIAVVTGRILYIITDFVMATLFS